MTSHDDLERAFDQWVLDPARGADVAVPVHLRRGGLTADRWPVADLLYELADDDRAVDERVAAALHLPPASTYARAARLLWATRSVWAGVGVRT